jgi:hypothetical protein
MAATVRDSVRAGASCCDGNPGVVDDHGRPVASQLDGRLAAEPPPAAGDDGNLGLQRTHASVSRIDSLTRCSVLR